MAKKVITQLIDDLTGEAVEDGESIQFTWEEQRYEIDLGEKNAEAFKKIMKTYVDAAAEIQPEPLVPAPRRTRASSGAKGAGRSKEELQAIRDWARAQGQEINDRGRIAQSVQDAYDEAQRAASK